MWFLKADDKERYNKMFSMFDKESKGHLSDQEMQQVMVSTKMEKAVCAKVWQLSNPKLESTFTKAMFTIAMHLMFRKRQDPNLQMPDVLPPELALSAASESQQVPMQPQPLMN